MNKVHVDLLSLPPISGTIPERHYDVSGGANTWVRFEADDGAEWVGVFGSAELALYEAAVPFAGDAGQTVLVIAGGQGYIVDATSGTLVRRTPWDYAYSAVAVPDRDFVLVADTSHIWATDRATDRLVRAEPHPRYSGGTSQVALDGIEFEGVTTKELTGRVWEGDGWFAFHVDIDRLIFHRGARLTTEDIPAFTDVPPAG